VRTQPNAYTPGLRDDGLPNRAMRRHHPRLARLIMSKWVGDAEAEAAEAAALDAKKLVLVDGHVRIAGEVLPGEVAEPLEVIDALDPAA
jgi:hypothetical protein